VPTLHSIHRCGVVTHVGVPKFYNIPDNQTKNGCLEKEYSLTAKAKRTIKSSLVKMWYEKQNRLTFWTFTFKLSAETERIVTDQKLMNVYFSKLLENAKKSYGLHSYIWVSERTKKGTIHYHCVFDVPKLEQLKNKTYEQIKNSGAKAFDYFINYFKQSFKDYLAVAGCSIVPDNDYCAIGFPRKYDSNGVYRGAVVRNIQALSTYLAGYLNKCDRKESGGRIYAISRNVLERPTKTFNFSRPFEPEKTYAFDYCSVDYFKLSKGFDDFFIRETEEAKNAIETESDRARKEHTDNRKWRKKHMKIAASLQITQYFFEKYIRNADILAYSHYFNSLPESSYHNIHKVKQLKNIIKKPAIFTQTNLQFMTE
jgi:hypothetical protein